MMSKRRTALLSCLALGILLAASPAFAGNGGAGNGAPSGPHFDLNLIGVKQPKTQSNGGGGVIFVLLNGASTINLQAGPFDVVNNNATVPPGAIFQLPAPTTNGSFTYSVWARPVGKPGGTGIIMPTFTDTTGTVVAFTGMYMTMRNKGKSTFQDVSADLLFVTYVNTLGQTITVPILSTPENFLWNYNNQGLKNLQLRFYQQP